MFTLPGIGQPLSRSKRAEKMFTDSAKSREVTLLKGGSSRQSLAPLQRASKAECF